MKIKLLLINGIMRSLTSMERMPIHSMQSGQQTPPLKLMENSINSPFDIDGKRKHVLPLLSSMENDQSYSSCQKYQEIPRKDHLYNS
jgi:hypothetical protein